MSIASHTLTVNAAFLQEIKEDNCQLQEMLRETQELFFGKRVLHASPRAKVDALSCLRDQLAMHFALEDAYGYFEDAVAEAPRLSEQAAALRGEHVELFRMVCALAERAEQEFYSHHFSRTERALAGGLAKFFARFHEHEQRENELIMSAFDDDIGVGD